MATCQDLCDRAGRLLFGKSLTTAESADAFIAVNAMLSTWNNEGLLCYAIRDEFLTTDGSTSYTIGPSGDLDTTRPVAIVGAYATFNGSSLPVGIMEAEEYASISLKTSTADFPEKVYYQPSYAQGTLYPWPLPNGAVIHLLTRTPLTAFASLTDTVSLPPGWEELITYQLAVRVAPEFQLSVRPEVGKVAIDALAAIKRANSRPIAALNDVSMLFGRRRTNIFTNGQ